MLFACWPLDDDGVDVEVGAKEAMVGDDSKYSSIQCLATRFSTLHINCTLDYLCKHANTALQTNRTLYNSFLARENNDKTGCVQRGVLV